MSHAIRVDVAGVLTFVWSDELYPLTVEGATAIYRASHVEPDIRGGWRADLSPIGGPVIGPYRLRRQAIEAEVEWIQDHVILNPTPAPPGQKAAKS